MMQSSRRWYQPVLLLLVSFWLVACQWPQVPATHIEQPEIDHRAYRYLVLDNGLQVLLVSDPKADKAAVALDVKVGSRHDPAAYPGLAHFLEHMLFLGTEQYPEAGEYQEYITAHGGSNNAYTAFENTNYFFDIAPAYLEPALDRFSEFFIAPLLRPEYIQRERNAVHSEYMMGIRDDARRMQDVLKAVVNPRHPFSGFSVGNLDTLTDAEGAGSLRAVMEAFYQRYYRAERMALVVIGPQPLDLLEMLVRPRFKAVPDGGEQDEELDVPLLPADKPPQWVTLQPVREQRSLSILWPVDDPALHWRSQPLAYIANILGHEGEGSLLSWLKQQGWAQGLAAGTSLQYHGGALFRVTINLTEEGVQQADQVVAAVYRVLARIRNEGPQQWLYQEQATTAQQAFDYRESGQPIHDASALASSLQRYPASAVLKGPYTMEHFDAPLIETTLEQLRPDRMLVMVSAPEAAVEQHSPWYDVPYRSRPIAAEQLADWAQAEPDPALTLPAPNPFIVSSEALRKLSRAETVGSTVPVQLPPQGGLEVWFLQDARFAVPRTNFYLGLQSRHSSSTAQEAVLTELYVRMVREELNEFAYPAYLAGMGVEVRRTLRGLTVQLSGFSPQQPLLLEQVLAVLRTPRLDGAVLLRVMQEYRDELHNRAEQAPFRLLFEELGMALYPERWPIPALLKALDGVDASALAAHGQVLLNGAHAQLLVHGSTDEERARALADIVSLALPQTSTSSVPVAVTRWPTGQWRHSIASPHPDAGLLLYIQAPDTDLLSRAAFGVSLRMLEAPFYRQLRTEQQLGYVVMAGPYPQLEVPGAVFVAQSPVADPLQLQEAVRAFQADWLAQEEATLNELFQRHRESLSRELAQRPKNLAEAGQRYWQDLVRGETGFDSRERLRDAVQELDFAGWLVRFQRDVLRAPRALWLYHGAPAPEGETIADWSLFHEHAGHYRFFDATTPD